MNLIIGQLFNLYWNVYCVCGISYCEIIFGVGNYLIIIFGDGRRGKVVSDVGKCFGLECCMCFFIYDVFFIIYDICDWNGNSYVVNCFYIIF